MRFEIYFSYNQFMVYDTDVEYPGHDWTEAHFNQGFARRESAVCIGTLFQFGDAEVIIHRAAYQRSREHQRVIAVPLKVTSGRVIVEGPEEMHSTNVVAIEPGNYRLTVAQQVIDEEHELIEVYFEPVSEGLSTSQILVADEAMRPPSPVLETCEIA